MDWMKSKSYSYNQLSIFLRAPAKSGVFLLHNSFRCIYIGETENIRQSLLDHLRGKPPWVSVWDPDRFSFELCPEAARVQRQNELALQFRPVIEYPEQPADQAPPEADPSPMDSPLIRS
jgi:hypothetical protein